MARKPDKKLTKPKREQKKHSAPANRIEVSEEDSHDLGVVAKRQEEKPISLGEMKRRLKKVILR